MKSGFTKPSNLKSSKHTNFHNYSNITKLDYERRERGFQVFISGANKERLKISNLQQEALLSKKAKINSNITSTRKVKPLSNTFARRRSWKKNLEIKIKGSDGSKFAFHNQKPSKPNTDLYDSVLHDITTKIKFHSSARKNSQLNLIRNRYKAYFHIDGYGFCCSKQTSKQSIPTKYQSHGASSIFNRSNSKHLNQFQNKNVCHSYSLQPYGNEEQKNQYYSLLDSNHKRISKLQEFFTSDYEYFQSTNEGTILDPYKGVAIETSCTNSYNGIIYNVFYYKEQNIYRSAKALLPMDNQDENGSINDDGNEKDESNVIFQDEPCSHASLQVNNLEENEDENDENDEKVVFYKDDNTLVLLENQGSLNGFVNNNNKNEETNYLPPLEKALSPIFKLVKNDYNLEEEKRSCMVRKYQILFNHDDKLSSNSIIDGNQTSKNVNSGKRRSLKLNLRYLYQGLNFKTQDRPTLDSIQLYVGDGTSTNSNNNGSNQTREFSTSDSSTLDNIHTSPARMSGLEKVDLKLLMEDKAEQIIKRGKLLSARVKKLDIKKQIYLSHILDKLDVVQVTRSIDFNFCQHTL